MNQLIPALLLIPGFWLGWKAIPLLVDWLQNNPNHLIQLSSGHKIILWLTVGSLFSNTLLRLYGLLYPLVTMLAIPGWCNTQPNFMTRFGSIGFCLYNLPSILIYLIIFGIVFSSGYSFFSNQTTKINKFYIICSLLTISTIINQMVYFLFNQLFWSP